MKDHKVAVLDRPAGSKFFQSAFSMKCQSVAM